MKKKWLYISPILILIGILYFFIYSSIKKTKPALPVLGNPGHKVGSFSLIDQVGDTVTQDILSGKVSVVEYFYTSCTGICVPMNKNMGKVYEDLKDTPGFQIISNTVDPETDSVPVLAKYAEQWDANPEVWKFLTGSKEELFTTAVQEYLLNAADSIGVTGEYVHTNWFALVDQKRQIRGFYDGLKSSDMKKLEADIKQLLKAEKED